MRYEVWDLENEKMSLLESLEELNREREQLESDIERYERDLKSKGVWVDSLREDIKIMEDMLVKVFEHLVEKGNRDLAKAIFSEMKLGYGLANCCSEWCFRKIERCLYGEEKD